MKTFEIEAMFTVQCEGKYCEGTKARFNHTFGNHLPGDPDEISNFKVFIAPHGQKIEITHAITQKEREVLMSYFLEHCRNERAEVSEMEIA